jgi:hypothetical protein
MEYDRFRPNPHPVDDDSTTDYTEPPVKDYSQFLDNPGSKRPSSPQQRQPRRKAAVIILILVVLAGGGYGAYYHTNHKAVASQPATTAQTKPTKPTAATPKIATTSYDSPNFNLALNYPTGWTVAGDTASSLTIESPAMQLTSSAGQSVSGKVVLSLQPEGQLPSAFGTSDATAVLNSQLISYAQPTSTQRAQTYLSFVQYASTTTTGALDGIYITGDYGYQKDQTIPRSDIAGLDPLATVTFGKCADTACTSLTTTNITASSWTSTSFSPPILTLLKSLAFS